MSIENDGDLVVSAIIKTLEQNSNKKVLRVIAYDEESSAGDSLPAFVVFVDGSILQSEITVFPMDGELAVRVQWKLFIKI